MDRNRNPRQDESIIGRDAAPKRQRDGEGPEEPIGSGDLEVEFESELPDAGGES